MSDNIVLHDVEGIARKTGTDQHDCVWTEFEVDYGAEQQDGECAICGRAISSGWMCLDGGEEVCRKHVTIEDAPEWGSFDHIRTWRHGDYRLELFDTYQSRYGKSCIAYQFFHNNTLVFQCDEFGVPPQHTIDGDATVAGVLTFIALRPGDTDREYFDAYTREQLEFAQQEGEALYSLVDQLRKGGQG